MNAKSIVLSKTFWLNLLFIIAAFFPQVNTWIADNVQTTASVWGALNILLRFATNGRITLQGAGETDGTATGMPPCWVMGIAAAGLVATALPSCTTAGWQAARSIPIRTCAVTDYGTVCYSSKGGVTVEVDATSGK